MPGHSPRMNGTWLGLLGCTLACALLGCGADEVPPDAAAPSNGDATSASDVEVRTDSSGADTEMVADASGAPDTAALDRPILAFSGDTAVAANQAALPPGWSGIEPTRCADDPTRQFIGELVTHGITDIQVLYHWAPVVPGPDPDHPVQGMPDWYASGRVAGVAESTDDVRADHPFGFDYNWDLQLDADFAYMVPAPGDTLHCEIEMPVFPRDALGYDPAPGDRGLVLGAWVLDCGHPPYHAEMHPPTFLAFARDNSGVTESVAVANPYRIAQLYAPTVEPVAAFGDDTRFSAQGVLPFPTFLVNAIIKALLGQIDRIEGHLLMEALRFDRIEWDVCAPGPRPAGAQLDASWRFVARTGVSIEAAPDDQAGCVHFAATMDDTYEPAPLTPHVVDWPWEGLSASASEQLGEPVDVRQKLIEVAKAQGFDNADTVPALSADSPPRVDHYDPLVPRPGADQDAPTAIVTGADDQPFPFYGRVRVGWTQP